MRDTSDTTAELDLATIKRCSGDFVWGVSGVVWAPGPAVGFKGYGVPPVSSRKRFSRALIKLIIVESACAACSVGPCTRENKRSRSQSPPVLLPRCVVGVVQNPRQTDGE